ncbi:MAG TPA: 4-hydroxy-tetrahydrodipicolinate synthase [Peptococcaceae bacterium]|jgi:4-hydroxy-tetrahydrodipicolinate synthase|nr:4-hydroxy-tetrahydrodipicolinate synthase [Clostridia bacterium]HOB81890.1 4-hydroxy-tetrahydrodipicolinate synthase [Peptococcaceae bacterium]HQD53858.1 4-hydroxy-tetrahydrodipicolinate synthase [Peptococcaceae bacterium]
MTNRKMPRLVTAMITPFKNDLSVDYEGAQKLALQLIEDGNEGIVVSGTTGESPNLTMQEKLDLYKAVKEAVGPEAWVIAGTGSNCTRDSVSLTEEASKLGVDGVMLVAPYYNKPSQEGLYQHFKTVASATDLPVIVYNVPGRTSANILPDTVARLAADVPNIIAIKEACGNMDQVTALKNAVPENFFVYSGDDSMTLPMLAVGCYGIISVVAHIAAADMRRMIEAYLMGDVQLASQLHLKLFPLIKAMFLTTNPVPVKKALELLGRPSGKVRLPLVEATVAETQAIAEAMKKAGVL